MARSHRIGRLGIDIERITPSRQRLLALGSALTAHAKLRRSILSVAMAHDHAPADFGVEIGPCCAEPRRGPHWDPVLAANDDGARNPAPHPGRRHGA